MTKKIIVVDITVANCSIRAVKREYGTLKGRALRKAQKLVNENGDINISGEYGSMIIDEKDFTPNE